MPSYISIVKPNETDFGVSSCASLRYTRTVHKPARLSPGSSSSRTRQRISLPSKNERAAHPAVVSRGTGARKSLEFKLVDVILHHFKHVQRSTRERPRKSSPEFLHQKFGRGNGTEIDHLTFDAASARWPARDDN
jgi:hypothetical protein